MACNIRACIRRINSRIFIPWWWKSFVLFIHSFTYEEPALRVQSFRGQSFQRSKISDLLSLFIILSVNYSLFFFFLWKIIWKLLRFFIYIYIWIFISRPCIQARTYYPRGARGSWSARTKATKRLCNVHRLSSYPKRFSGNTVFFTFFRTCIRSSYTSTTLSLLSFEVSW